MMSRFVVYFYVFFFFKQKTAYEMRISDWSSDVCSSDLLPAQVGAALVADDRGRDAQRGQPLEDLGGALQGLQRLQVDRLEAGIEHPGRFVRPLAEQRREGVAKRLLGPRPDLFIAQRPLAHGAEGPPQRPRTGTHVCAKVGPPEQAS